MNELTKKLVNQFATNLLNRSGYDMREYEPFISEAEKFAELIVRECVEVLRMVPYDCDGPEFGDEVVYQEAVKKHFGVEE